MAKGINILLAANMPKIIQQIHDQLNLTTLKINSIINAESLDSVVEYLDKPDIDVLIVDVDYALPDLAKSFQTIQYQFPDKPIVALIDIEDFDTARQAVTQGAHGFAIKTELKSSILECVILQAIDRMEIRSQLHESNRQIKNLMDNLPGIAYRCKNDKDWTMEFISAGCRQLTGYDADDIQFNKKLSFNDLIHPDDRQMVSDDIQKANKENRQFQLEYRIRTADNREKWVWEQGSLINNIHGIQTLEGFITDISDWRQRESNMHNLIEIGDLLREPSAHFDLGNRILGKIASLYGLSCSAIAMVLNQNNSIKMEIVQGGWEDLINKEISIKGFNCREAIQNKEPVVLDSQIDHSVDCKPLQSKDSPYLVFLPLNSEEQPARFLVFGRSLQFSENDAQVFTAIGDLMSSALGRFNLIQRLEKQLERVESLHAIDQAITGVFDIRVINRVILEEVRKGLGADAADIMHLNPLTNTLDLCGDVGLRSSFIHTRKVPTSTSIAGKVLMNRSAFEAPDLSKNPVEFQFKDWDEEGFKAYFAHPLIVKGKPIGVMELFFRHTFYPDPEWFKFFESLAAQAAVAYDSCHTFSDLQRVKQNLSNTYNAALETWSKSLELTNIENHGHVQRVTRQTLMLAKELGIDENELPNIERGALLHDIGKLGILDEILLKKGELSDTEWHEIERHPVIAKDLLSGVNLLKDAIDIPFSHHENWDGSGYPQGLRGEAIPKAARIFAVVETYDALLSEKPYRDAWTQEKAIEYLKQERGKKFDPKIIDAFFKQLNL
jgi:PAS domain S-box-containing protein